MAAPSDALSCPYCGAPVDARRSRCPGCDVRLLYGLVAPAESDPGIQERVALALEATPGGPGRLEGRRRVREGLPLIVGLSRERTEELQGRLVDLGLVPRIGPAPRGTAPLEPEPAHRGLLGRVAVALAIPVIAFAVFRWLEPEPPKPDPAAAAAAEAAEPERAVAAVELSAGIERERHGHMWLVVAARSRREGPPPDGDVVLRLRDEAGTVLWTGSVSTQRAQDVPLRVGGKVLTQRTVQGRISLRDVSLRDGDRLTLEARWEGSDSDPIPIEVPAPHRRR